MKQVPIIIHGERIEVSEYHTRLLKQAVKDNNAPIRGIIQVLQAESSKQRKYLMGGLIPLLIYLDGGDYKDNETCDRYFQVYKAEFFPEAVKINGKIHLFGQSTKGSKSLNRFIERVQDFISEQYGISYSNEAINPEKYKEWRDTEMSLSTEDWIDYCVKMKWVK